jgi:hypothetical protein
VRKYLSIKFLTGTSTVHLSVLLCCAFVVCIFSFDSSAQNKPQKTTVDRLPTVRTIKDYPATGLMTGCGNLYFYPATRHQSSSAAYIFLAHGDGSNAWMNLRGHDVRLTQIKSLTKKNRTTRRYYYRLGELSVNVVIINSKPKTADAGEGDSRFQMTIALRRDAQYGLFRQSVIRTVEALENSKNGYGRRSNRPGDFISTSGRLTRRRQKGRLDHLRSKL